MLKPYVGSRPFQIGEQIHGRDQESLELLRLLITHPRVEVAAVTSRQYQGKMVQEVFPSLGPSGLVFSNPAVEELTAAGQAVFTAVPHQEAGHHRRVHS